MRMCGSNESERVKVISSRAAAAAAVKAVKRGSVGERERGERRPGSRRLVLWVASGGP